MKVFLLGGTGAIGGHALPALVAAGHDVVGAGQVPGEGCVVRAQGGSPVQESVSMIYPDRGDAWIDERVEPDPYPNARGNLAAEASAARFARAGGVGVVLRLGLFYGPGQAVLRGVQDGPAGVRHSEQFLSMARRHVVPLVGRRDSYLSSIHVADGGTAVVAALQVPTGTYNVVDDEPLTKHDYAEALAAAAGTRPWIRGPGRLAHVLGHRMASLTRSMRVANGHFRETSGWRPRYPSAHEGWLATASSLDRTGSETLHGTGAP